MKDKLIEKYVNLYRIIWLGNTGLWTEDLERMKEIDLRKDIKDMERIIKEKNTYYPAFRPENN